MKILEQPIAAPGITSIHHGEAQVLDSAAKNIIEGCRHVFSRYIVQRAANQRLKCKPIDKRLFR